MKYEEVKKAMSEKGYIFSKNLDGTFSMSDVENWTRDEEIVFYSINHAEKWLLDEGKFTQISDDEWVSDDGIYSVSYDGVYENNRGSSRKVDMDREDIPNYVQEKYDELLNNREA